jgi:hypothetical protein|tara:strand:+ start:16116 stop:16232 length:117 start_codon:yes stop_codon:yes gene_type:complete
VFYGDMMNALTTVLLNKGILKAEKGVVFLMKSSAKMKK